jgi:dihydroorotase
VSVGAAADLVVRNGQVFDAVQGSFTTADVVVTSGVISALGPDAAEGCAAAEFVDATELFVSPGLIDMHTHVFPGQVGSVPTRLFGPAGGTTTFVDAGSAGAHLWEAFITLIDQVEQRVVPFINISTIGFTSFVLEGELATPPYVSIEACVAAVSQIPRAAGVKVRASENVGHEHTAAGLRAARTAADELDLPLMVHLGPAPMDIDTILGTLRTGDILTHCFTGFAENGLIVDGALRPSILDARERGVVFDVGHGMGGFRHETAQRAFDLGFLPDTISTDLHAYSADLVGDLPTTLSRFLAIGLSLPEVLARATVIPAQVLGLLGQGVGQLTVGGVADIAVLRLVDETVDFVDVRGNAYRGSQKLTAEHTIQAGRVLAAGTL